MPMTMDEGLSLKVSDVVKNAQGVEFTVTAVGAGPGPQHMPNFRCELNGGETYFDHTMIKHISVTGAKAEKPAKPKGAKAKKGQEGIEVQPEPETPAGISEVEPGAQSFGDPT